MPPSLFPLIHSPCIWKMSQHGDKYEESLLYWTCYSRIFKEKRERGKNTKSISTRGMISFLRFRNKLQNLWTISTCTNMEPCQATYSAHHLTAFFPSFFSSSLLPELIVSDVARFCINRVSGFYLSTSQSPNLSMAETCGVIFSSFTLCQL